MNKPLIDLYKYYPDEFKCLSYEQLLIVNEHFGKQEIKYKKQLEELEQKHVREKRRQTNGHYFAAIPVGFIVCAVTTQHIDHWLVLVFGVPLICVAAGIVHGLAQSFYVNLIENEKATKGGVIIKTIGAVIVCAIIALCLHGRLF